MRKAGFLGIIHIDLDFSGTDLANGTKNSDDVHREVESPIEDDPPALGGYRGEKRASLAVLAVRSTHNLVEMSQLAG